MISGYRPGQRACYSLNGSFKLTVTKLMQNQYTVLNEVTVNVMVTVTDPNFLHGKEADHLGDYREGIQRTTKKKSKPENHHASKY